MRKCNRRFVYHYWATLPSGHRIKAFGWVDGTSKKLAHQYIQYYCNKEGYELISIEERKEVN